ncbi:nucleotide-binding domain-containing protein [Choiromyces venosus 120613-1]|uniref:Nucleotide-binding domain-containing protein n=1 Tax=Choiromyces venosus 120613-1 TaxID=1336337 RepID=A0A3N4JYK1_9PEZI|nr:nucleotide-binding domain-containing protein [Choiromyces venosus 120613-1]
MEPPVSPLTKLVLPNFNCYLQSLANTLSTTPGQPVSNPTSSFWLSDPPPVFTHQSPTLPPSADVVIIGSGITGTAAARTLLSNSPDLRVAMLDARETCSGATGRNGGHIKPNPWELFPGLTKTLGRDKARKVTEFRMGILDKMIGIAEAEGVAEDCQIRRVEAVDVHLDAESWVAAKACLDIYLEEFPEETEKWKAYEGEEARQKFSTPHAQGIIAGPAGALWPARLIHPILTRLLSTHPSFTLDTCTPVISITPPDSPTSSYVVHTPRGEIKATHILHATNGYTANLLPGLTGALFPIRGTMTAQSPPTQNHFHGHRSWQFSWNQGYDYLTTLPNRTVMFGGGLRQALTTELGTVDDSVVDVCTTVHLSGVLPAIGLGTTVQKIWTGIMGFSGDVLPWIGEVPAEISGRQQGAGKEWVAAGYTGDGMCTAWGAAEEVVARILGLEGGVGVIEEMDVTVERAERAKGLEGLVGLFFG